MPALDLEAFQLPLSSPPSGYAWSDHSLSSLSARSAFDTGIDERDRFLGRASCIICGYQASSILERCHIISQLQDDVQVWRVLRARGWIPSQAKLHAAHEPRNGILMCPDHRKSFDSHDFFIRYFPGYRSESSADTNPKIGKYVLINYSGLEDLRPFHNKAIALDPRDKHAPYPTLFIVHEMRTRGFHPFGPNSLDIPDDFPWQDWIISRGVLRTDDALGWFSRDLPTPDPASSTLSNPPAPPEAITTTAFHGAN